MTLVCALCVVASVHVFDSHWAYNRALKNDNKRPGPLSKEANNNRRGKSMKEDKKGVLLRFRFLGWEMPGPSSNTPSVKFTSRDSLGVAHHRFSMDEQSVIRYSLQVAFFFTSLLSLYIFLPFFFLRRLPGRLNRKSASLNCLSYEL